jgi:hypothetical protein
MQAGLPVVASKTAELETENGAGFQAEEGDGELSVAQAQAILDGRYA